MATIGVSIFAYSHIHTKAQPTIDATSPQFQQCIAQVNNYYQPYINTAYDTYGEGGAAELTQLIKQEETAKVQCTQQT